MNNLNEKINASIMFTSYFDTLGFNNGNWEFFSKGSIENNVDASFVWFEILHQYYALGGSNINLSKWKSSDDTILTLVIGEGCLNGGKSSDYIKSFKKYYKLLKEEIRYSGINTMLTLKDLFKKNNIEKLKYSSSMGGNGAAIRTSSIGLIYHKENDIDKLIEQSIKSSRMTHNYPLGFLSGLTTALFTSYALRGILPNKWCDLLLKLNESKKIDDYMKKTKIYEKYKNDKNEFWNVWYDYREKRMISDKESRSKFIFSRERLEDLENYTLSLKNSNDYSNFGGSGIGALIIAYDALLTSSNFINNNLEISLDSIIFFGVLHFGDNDSSGAILGSWYGALQGYKNFDKNKMKQLEFYDKLNKLSNNIFKIK